MKSVMKYLIIDNFSKDFGSPVFIYTVFKVLLTIQPTCVHLKEAF